MRLGLSTMGEWAKQLGAVPYGNPVKGAPVTPEQKRIRELEKKIKPIETEKSSDRIFRNTSQKFSFFPRICQIGKFGADCY